jgi:hypothetical protein
VKGNNGRRYCRSSSVGIAMPVLVSAIVTAVVSFRLSSPPPDGAMPIRDERQNQRHADAGQNRKNVRCPILPSPAEQVFPSHPHVGNDSKVLVGVHFGEPAKSLLLRERPITANALASFP